ncbi:MAG: ABC transporter permease, partial [Bacteroidota bacterium]|nr:ABC transporter permease [Bacteroidota bacterium]
MRGHNLLSALVAIRSSGFRTFLTILIISIGVAGLIAMQSAIVSIESNLTSQFVDLGANSIKVDDNVIQEAGQNDVPLITLDEARRCANHFLELGFATSFHRRFKPNAQITFSSRSTNPNISLIGGNLHYIANNG